MITLGKNISSLVAQRRLAESSSTLQGTFERLSAGQRINRASDDAAGLAIADQLRADTRVHSRAIQNLNDGISYTNMVSAALDATSSVVVRLRELASQSANGVLSYAQRAALNSEAQALRREVNRIVESAQFNGISLFRDDTSLSLQGGYGPEGALQFSLGKDFANQVGDGTWQSSVTYDLPAAMWSSTLADLNGDGNLDLISHHQNEFHYRVSLGNGDGTFAANHSYSISHYLQYLSTGDLDNNGNVDIMHTSPNNLAFQVHFGNGAGGRSSVQTITFSSWVSNFSANDFNNDGLGDVAIAADNGIQILQNSTGTSLATTQFISLGAINTFETNVATGDFDGDGDIDIVAANYNDRTVWMLRGNGDGTFGAAKTISQNPFTVGTSPINDLFVTDINNDGFDDFILKDGFTSSTASFLSNGDGTFRKVTQSNIIGGEMKEADINGDGIPDLITFATGTGVRAYLGNGDGHFGEALVVLNGNLSGTARLAVGDVDNDGATDVIVGRNGLTGYTVSLGNSAASFTMPHFNILSQGSALESFAILDATLRRIAEEQSNVGAAQARISTAVRVLETSVTQQSAAEQRIRDADIAAEAATLVRTKILQQSAASVLAQANQIPSLALKLLRPL